MENYTDCGKLVKNTNSASETFKFGQEFAAGLEGQNIFLWGELGAGKTTFLKGLGRGLGIKKPVISPSFQLLRKYSDSSGRLRLIHLDLYRLSSPEEILHLGWNEYLQSPAAVAVEWSDRAWKICPREGIYIEIAHVAPGKRKLMIYQNKSSVPGI